MQGRGRQPVNGMRAAAAALGLRVPAAPRRPAARTKGCVSHPTPPPPRPCTAGSHGGDDGEAGGAARRLCGARLLGGQARQEGRQRLVKRAPAPGEERVQRGVAGPGCGGRGRRRQGDHQAHACAVLVHARRQAAHACKAAVHACAARRAGNRCAGSAASPRPLCRPTTAVQAHHPAPC